MHIDRIVNSVFTSNTFLLSDREHKGKWLIDVGDVEPVFSLLPDGAEIRGVFLTHTHYDHIYGINRLVERFPHCLVYTSEEGRKGLLSDKLNFSRYHDDPIVFEGENVRTLSEGDRVKLFDGVYLYVMETPGHDRSCMSYYTEKEFFSGDSHIPGVKVIATFPNSNKEDAKVSEQKILKIAGGRDLYPGHGEIYCNYTTI